MIVNADNSPATPYGHAPSKIGDAKSPGTPYGDDNTPGSRNRPIGIQLSGRGDNLNASKHHRKSAESSVPSEDESDEGRATIVKRNYGQDGNIKDEHFESNPLMSRM